MIDDTYIEKITKFTNNEELKADFRISIVLSMKEEIEKLSILEISDYFDYFVNIMENMYVIEEVYMCCIDEITQLLSSKTLGCIKYIKLTEIKNKLSNIANKTSACYYILQNIVEKMI